MSDDYSELKAAENDSENGLSKNLFVALPMILIGIIFLILNFTDFALNNWWALFFLIPIGFTITTAIRNRREQGELDQGTRSMLVGAMFMALLMFVFLFSWDWGKIWPLFLIVAGIGFIVGRWAD